jgi:hypothetical protein
LFFFCRWFKSTAETPLFLKAPLVAQKVYKIVFPYSLILKYLQNKGIRVFLLCIALLLRELWEIRVKKRIYEIYNIVTVFALLEESKKIANFAK